VLAFAFALLSLPVKQLLPLKTLWLLLPEGWEKNQPKGGRKSREYSKKTHRRKK
jgi:hypothetical protein